MTGDELDKLNICGTPDGALWDMQNPDAPRLIVAPGSIDPEYFNVLRSVSVAHVALKAQLYSLDALVIAAEEAGLDHFVPAIMACTSAVHVARRVALDGIEAISAEQERHKKP